MPRPRDGVLSIGARQGSYPGMASERTFNLVLVKPGGAGGIDSLATTRAVRYDGKPLAVTLQR